MREREREQYVLQFTLPQASEWVGIVAEVMHLEEESE